MSPPDNMSIHRIPFVRLLLPFLAGIILGLTRISSSWVPITFLMLAGGVMAFLAFAARDPSVKYRRSSLGGAGVLLMFLAAGWIAAFLAREEVTAKTSLVGPAIVRGYILQPATERSRSQKVVIGVEAVRQEGKWYRAGGEAVLYFRKESQITEARTGDMLLLRTHLRKFPFYNNPGEFNYRRYMNDRGFFWEGYVKQGAWYRIPGEEKRSLKVLAGRVRASLVQLLKDHGLSGQRLAVAAALLTGEREYIDRETRSFFSASGTMHILAISGLHVGIIYLVLMWLFRSSANVEALKYLRFFVILPALWGYAFLTGLSPSVTRAALMFSLFLTADVFQRKSDPYNTLAVAAFLMLMIHPLLVRDAAFQLSYLAVLGIVAFYRPFTRPLLTGFPVIDKVWSLVAVSLAAQIVTFPLTIHYFHRLSLLSPLTNLLVIPLVTLFIYGGLLFFLLHSLSFVALPLSVFLDKTAGLLLRITARAGTLPHVQIAPAWLRPAGVVWFYLLILAVILLIRDRTSRAFLFLQVLLLLGAGGLLMREIKTHNTSRLVVFNIPGQTSFLFSYGDQGVLVDQDAGKANYYTENAGDYFGMKKIYHIPAGELAAAGSCRADGIPPGILLREGFFASGGICGYFLTDSTFRNLHGKVKVDEMIFSGKKWWLVKRQLRSVDPARIILGPSVSSYAARRIRESCPDRTILEVRHAGPCVCEEMAYKIMHKSFPLLCNFYTFAP